MNSWLQTPFSASQLIACMASESDILNLVLTKKDDDPTSEEEQTAFALMVKQYWASKIGPSKRYLRSLVRNYIRKIGEHNVHSEALLNLLLQLLVLPQNNHQDIPDPHQSCHVSFPFPSLTLRIFPYHNDVALRIWEAGATLAEYLLQNPQFVRNKRVVELGAGVGLTSLVLATTCEAAHVYCTDFTDLCLENMQHNVDLNEVLRVKQPDCISCGYLEWEAFGDYQESSDPRLHRSCEIIAQANVLIAADVVYDVSAIPALVKTFKRFLLEKNAHKNPQDDTKEIFLASTMRNQETFAVLQQELIKEGMDSRLQADGNYCAKLPLVFPMNFVQPRSDVNIYALNMIKS